MTSICDFGASSSRHHCRQPAARVYLQSISQDLRSMLVFVGNSVACEELTVQ